LSDITTVYKENNVVAVTSTPTDLVAAIAADHVAEVTALFVANYSMSDEEVIVTLEPAGGELAQITIPAKSRLDVLKGDARMNLKEGQSIQVACTNASRLNAIANWTDMS